MFANTVSATNKSPRLMTNNCSNAILTHFKNGLSNGNLVLQGRMLCQPITTLLINEEIRSVNIQNDLGIFISDDLMI